MNIISFLLGITAIFLLSYLIGYTLGGILSLVPRQRTDRKTSQKPKEFQEIKKIQNELKVIGNVIQAKVMNDVKSQVNKAFLAKTFKK